MKEGKNRKFMKYDYKKKKRKDIKLGAKQKNKKKS